MSLQVITRGAVHLLCAGACLCHVHRTSCRAGICAAGRDPVFGALNPLRVLARNLLYYFFFFLLLAVTNPLFAHNGETILFFMNDNPITLEAFVYGAALAIMIVGVMFWCKNYNLIMTSDKFIYLFGKAIPRLSLVLSLALRFIPLFKEQIHKINQTQKVMGLYSTDSRMDRLMSGMRVFNSILSWAIENSLETARMR